jgi:hypothetical protein
MITTDLDFPESIQCFLRDGYGIQHVSPLLRTEMATGRARQRRLYKSVPSTIYASLMLSKTQAQAFESWFAGAADDGAKWFNATIKTPMGSKPYVCRFVDMYQGPTLVGHELWRVECPLEIYERQILPAEWGKFGTEFITDQNIIDIAANREWPLA